MKKVIVLIIVFAIFSVTITSVLNDQFAVANSRKKIHFTETFESTRDLGIGHNDHQMSLVLSPNKDSLYDGSLTYSSSKPVEIMVLHEIGKHQVGGQPIWTVDDETLYAITILGPSDTSGSFEFTGAAVGLHSEDSEPFTATVSVDGWIRGQPTEIVFNKFEITKETKSIPLAYSIIPVNYTMKEGIFEGDSVFYIITDSNDEEIITTLGNNQTTEINYSPSMSNFSKNLLGDIFVFKNGIKGNGTYDYQKDVFSSTPTNPEIYSPYRILTEVQWKVGQKAEILNSTELIIEAEKSERVILKETEIILNSPQIIWPNGQIMIRENSTITEDSTFEGGQVLKIDEDERKVTFAAHRGWGPDGKTVYYIITDVTPMGPAKLIGGVNSPILANEREIDVAIDFYEFNNGIEGQGPLGFQPVILSSSLTDDNYVPLCKVSIVEWNEPENASVLVNLNDITMTNESLEVIVKLARPTNNDHFLNCPFVDPFEELRN